MKTRHKKDEKCAKCSKPLGGIQYLEDIGWICEVCMDEEIENEK